MTDKPTPEDISRWQRRLASQANNHAWTLAESPQRSPEEDEDMLHASHAAMYFWSMEGTPAQRAHAALLLAHVHALLRQPESAARYLARAWPHFETGECAPWEMAFAHAVTANVAFANRDATAHARHYADAQTFADRMTDADTCAMFAATWRIVPQPGS
ncbi:hypothetical protein [Dyella sp. C11]|uniref:hypothetical protein n=1 Tax=Dyella sp. C11 TaxID=2126991 RepID=UPI000D6568B2|nr:hypothetical protein [Dyella sp. C11]